MGHCWQMVVHLDKALRDVLPLRYIHTRCLKGSHPVDHGLRIVKALRGKLEASNSIYTAMMAELES